MSEEAEPQEPKQNGLIEFIKQWQVVVAVMAATVSLWFSYSEHLTKRAELNRDAIQQASGDDLVADFISDPHNTINLMQASYPDHAFCASLGVLAAHQARLQVAILKEQGESGRANLPFIDEAMQEEMSRLAALASVDLFKAQSFNEAAENSGDLNCAAIPERPGLMAALFQKKECRGAVETYLENRCIVAREVLFKAERDAKTEQALALAQAELSKIEPVVWPDAGQVDDCPNCELVVEVPAADYGDVLATCPEPPLIYAQYRAAEDQAGVEELLMWLKEAGFPTAKPELVAGTSQGGDVRYYSAGQEPCAVALSAVMTDIMSRHFGMETDFPAFSLEGRFKNLPTGRMELWFPNF